MSYDDILHTAGFIISFIGLMITLLKLSYEQRKSNELKEKQEKRIEYKLRIYDILRENFCSFEEMVDRFNAQNPLKTVDVIELRKCIYEMLTEDVLVSFEDGTYTANTAEHEED